MSIAEKLITVAENQQRVYDAGKQAEYDRFWDAAQDKGNRTDYTMAFCGFMWDMDNFKPKYDMRPSNAQMMFSMNFCSGSLPQLLDRAGVVLDFSNCTVLTQCFAAAQFTELGVIDVRKASNIQNTFANMTKLQKIEKLIVSSALTYSNAFTNCPALEEITIEGTIGQTGLNLSKSTNLTHDSLMSIINALQSGATSKTLTLGTTNLAKLSNEEKAIATQKGWTLA